MSRSISRHPVLLAALVVCLSLVAIGWAVPANTGHQFFAVLNSGQEVPPGTSGAFGVAHMTLLDDGMLRYAISFNSLTSAETAAHFHGPALPGVNASVVFPLSGGNPKNGTLGPLTAEQIADFRAGLYYVNVHSENFPSGEIRGQVLPAN